MIIGSATRADGLADTYDRIIRARFKSTDVEIMIREHEWGNQPRHAKHAPILRIGLPLADNQPHTLRKNTSKRLPIGTTPFATNWDLASLSISVFAQPIEITKDQVDAFLSAGAERVSV